MIFLILSYFIAFYISHFIHVSYNLNKGFKTSQAMICN